VYCKDATKIEINTLVWVFALMKKIKLTCTCPFVPKTSMFDPHKFLNPSIIKLWILKTYLHTILGGY
jgi:hypothetical protein